jgi:1-acyl-sn-glycerol-3-phosphate acyltransferase
MRAMSPAAPPGPFIRPTLLQRLARSLLAAAGWKAVYEPLPGPKGLVIVYPHTSNWDFIVGVLYKFAVGLPANWVGKDTLFRWPLGPLFQRIGGIPVNRSKSSGFVRALLDEFKRRDMMWVALAPEGTRSHSDHWKSGFYRIAVAARLPVGLGYIDYGTRTLGIDTYLTLSGDPEADMARLRHFYADKRGRIPGNAGEIRLRL